MELSLKMILPSGYDFLVKEWFNHVERIWTFWNDHWTYHYLNKDYEQNESQNKNNFDSCQLIRFKCATSCFENAIYSFIRLNDINEREHCNLQNKKPWITRAPVFIGNVPLNCKLKSKSISTILLGSLFKKQYF